MSLYNGIHFFLWHIQQSKQPYYQAYIIHNETL